MGNSGAHWWKIVMVYSVFLKIFLLGHYHPEKEKIFTESEALTTLTGFLHGVLIW